MINSTPGELSSRIYYQTSQNSREWCIFCPELSTCQIFFIPFQHLNHPHPSLPIHTRPTPLNDSIQTTCACHLRYDCHLGVREHPEPTLQYNSYAHFKTQWQLTSKLKTSFVFLASAVTLVSLTQHWPLTGLKQLQSANGGGIRLPRPSYIIMAITVRVNCYGVVRSPVSATPILPYV